MIDHFFIQGFINYRGILLMKNRRNYLKREKNKREGERILLLETELKHVKEKLDEQNKNVHLDEAQLNKFLDELTHRVEWSTNRIVDETSPRHVIVQDTSSKQDGVSELIKFAIASLIIAVGIGIFTVMFQSIKLFWTQGWDARFVIFFSGVVAIVCLCLGVEIFREKDRNYIISLFSALVSLTALIVSVIN